MYALRCGCANPSCSENSVLKKILQLNLMLAQYYKVLNTTTELWQRSLWTYSTKHPINTLSTL